MVFDVPGMPHGALAGRTIVRGMCYMVAVPVLPAMQFRGISPEELSLRVTWATLRLCYR